MSDQPRGPAPGGGPLPPPSTPPALDWDALARVLAGEPAPRVVLPNAAASDAAAPADSPVTPAADADARAWMVAHPAEGARLRAADALASAYLAPVDGPPAPVDVEAALARVHRQLTGADTAPSGRTVHAVPATAVTSPPDHVRPTTSAPPAPAVPRPVRPHRPAWATRTRWLAGGAALAAAAALAIVVTRNPIAGDSGALRYATATGQRTTVRLPDGTRVVLGPSSTLAAVGAYGRDTRTLTLQGEAYFEVTHDAARPFVVEAGPAVVRDLGTAFVVRAGAATEQALVAVTQGSVALTAADPAQEPVGSRRPSRPASADTAGAVLLHAGDRGLVVRPAGASAGTAPSVRKLAPAAGAPAGAADELAWTTGRLVFRDAPIPEVADALHRWYGVTLRVADPALAGRTLTASFQGDSPDEVLRVVALALGARLDRRGDTVFVRAAH